MVGLWNHFTATHQTMTKSGRAGERNMLAFLYKTFQGVGTAKTKVEKKSMGEIGSVQSSKWCGLTAG